MPPQTEILPSEVLARVKELELRTRKAVEEFLTGRYHSAFRGRGIEFHEVRDYLPGDEIRDIDWNVSARFGKPFVKTYVEERELTLLAVFDASPSMDFGSNGRSKRAAASEVLALLLLSAVRNGDRVGMVVSSGSPSPDYFPPRKGRDHALRLIREAIFHPAASASGAGVSRALETVLSVEKRRSVLAVISDFMGEDIGRILPLAARRHDTVLIQVYDPVEENLPDCGLVGFLDPETGRGMEVDSSSRTVRGLWNRRFRELSENLRSISRRAGADLITIRSDKDVLPPLLSLFGRRIRRRRR